MTEHAVVIAGGGPAGMMLAAELALANVAPVQPRKDCPEGGLFAMIVTTAPAALYGVELGETLEEAVIREVREETSLDVEPVALAGYRQAITRDAAGGVERHFVILPFAARWIAGEVALNEELAEAQWREPSALSDLKTTEGLELIVNAAWERITAR